MMDEHYDDDVAIRSHYPSDFKLTMSKRYPPAKRQLSPLSRRRRKIQGGVSKNKTVKRPSKARRQTVMDWQYIWNMCVISAVFMAVIATIIIGGMKWIGAL